MIPLIAFGIVPSRYFLCVFLSAPGILFQAILSKYRRVGFIGMFFRSEKNYTQKEDGPVCYKQNNPDARTLADSVSNRLILAEVYLFQSAFLSIFAMGFKIHMLDGGGHSRLFHNVKLKHNSLHTLVVLKRVNFIMS